MVALEAAWWEPLAVRRGARALGHAHRGVAPLRARGGRRGGAGRDRPPGAPPREDRRAARVRPGLVEVTGRERPARTVAAAAGAGERAARGRGAAPPADAHARVARLPRLRLRPRGDASSCRRGASTSRARRTWPRRWAGTSGWRGSRRPCRPRAARAGCAGLAAARAADPRRPDRASAWSRSSTTPSSAGARMPGAAEGRRRLANPLTEEQDTLRTSLVMPGLLDTLRTNLRLGRRDVAVFELGRVFSRGRAACRARSGGWRCSCPGARAPHHWSMKPRPFDLFDLKGVVELLFARLGEPRPELDRESAPPGFLHPGRAVSLRRDEAAFGYAGAVHPDVRASLGAQGRGGRAGARPRRPARDAPRRWRASPRSTGSLRCSGTSRSCATRRPRPPRSTPGCAPRRASACAR